jgi:hypothetical protein
MAVSFSGSLDISGSLNTTGTITMSGSIASASFATTASNAVTSSYVVSSQTDATQNIRLTTIEAVTGSYTLTSSFGTYTSSNDTTNTTQNSRIAANEAKTGSFATTGSNYFIGTQVITGSVYISSNLIVQGSSSLQNITASAVSIGTNTVILNTDSPAVRFAGISVRDSGSNSSVTSSIWYDSLNNKWIYQNESGSSYSGGMFISGPRNTGSLGDEASMTNGYITKGLGGDHIGPSIIFESGSTIGIGTSSPTGSNTSNLLHVAGANAVLRVGPQFATNDRDYIELIASGTDTKVTSPNERFWIENTAGSIIISASSGIGIGTTNPTRSLDVRGYVNLGSSTPSTSGSGYADIHLRTYSGATSSPAKIQVVDNWMDFYTTYTDGYRFRNYSSDGVVRDLITITGTGYVGIGITSPLTSLGKTLTVIGTGIFQNSAGGGSYNENLRLNRSTGNLYAAIALGGAYDSTSGTGVGQWTLVSTPAASSYAFDFDYNGATVIKFSTAGAATFNSSVTAGGVSVKPQFIANGGSSLGAGMSYNTGLSGTGRRNWFIGTEENIEGDFVIKCSTAAGGTAQSGDTRIAILNNGNVGIGTISPSAPLTVRSTGATGILLEQDGSNSAVSSRLVARNNSIAGTIRYDSSGWRFNTNATLNETSGTERALISTDGYFRMLSGTGGIQFQGNTGAANALNYYEQGSWTPALQNATVSYTDRSGTYVRIGDYVFVRWGFRISSISGQSGTITISGLPFTSVSWGSYQEPNISVSTGVLATADNAYRARVFVGGGNTSLFGRIANNSDTSWNTSDLQNGSWILGEIFYNVP